MIRNALFFSFICVAHQFGLVFDSLIRNSHTGNERLPVVGVLALLRAAAKEGFAGSSASLFAQQKPIISKLGQFRQSCRQA